MSNELTQKISDYMEIGSLANRIIACQNRIAELKELYGLSLTNKERIQMLPIDDLAEFLNNVQKEENKHIHESGHIAFDDVANGWLKWLESEADNG